MIFVVPDRDRYRISDCGQYIIEKHADKEGRPVYSLWRYERQSLGYESFDDARNAAMLNNMERWTQATDEQLKTRDPSDPKNTPTG